MRARRTGVVLATSMGLAFGASGCGSSGPSADQAHTAAPSLATSTAATTPVATPSLKPPRLPDPASRTSTRGPRAATGSGAICTVPAGVHASQVVVVRSSGSSATIRACQRSGSRYVLALGPYSGHVGIKGVSASKREGDLRTPAGTFALRGGFGRRANPGLAQSWLRVDSRDVWVDDSSSSLYNTHQRTPAAGRWTSAEPLDVSAYDYAQVIGYNEARTPGRGSAIFLHVDHGSGTAGCVSVPSSQLVSILRWERPGAVISIS